MEEAPAPNLAFIRLEQIHPYPALEVEAVRAGYSPKAKCLWVQEEPRNMGAWSFIMQHFQGDISCISRSTSASPASGSPVVHALRQKAILDEVFHHAHN